MVVQGPIYKTVHQEVGNQIASITSKINFSLFDQPITFNYEFAGEDTRDHKNYRLGNLSESYGFFFPYLTEDIALNLRVYQVP